MQSPHDLKRYLENENFKEIFFKILSYLDTKNLNDLKIVSKQFKLLIEAYLQIHKVKLSQTPGFYKQLTKIRLKKTEKIIQEQETEEEKNKTIRQAKLGNFSVLPNETIQQILSKLSPQDLEAMSQLSSFFEFIANNDHLWQKILIEWKHSVGSTEDIKIKSDSTYKHLFRSTSISFLQEKFKKFFGGVELKTPPVKQPGTLPITKKSRLEMKLYSGSPEKIAALKKSLTSLKDDIEKSDYLIHLIDLSLNNKNLGVFKAFMQALMINQFNPLLILNIDKTHKKLFKPAHGYIILNLVKNKIFATQELVDCLLNNLPESSWACSVLIAYDPASFDIMIKTLMSSPELLQKYIDNWSSAKLLIYAIKSHNVELITRTTPNQLTLLHYFIKNINLPLFPEFIILQDFNNRFWINTVTPEGESFLIYALKAGNLRAFKFLMQYAETDLLSKVDNNGDTLLHHICKQNYSHEYINYVFANKKIICIREIANKNNEVPIELAINSVELVKKLLQLGVDSDKARSYFEKAAKKDDAVGFVIANQQLEKLQQQVKMLGQANHELTTENSQLKTALAETQKNSDEIRLNI